MWCVAELNEEYIAHMEDVLKVYEMPLSERTPVVCADEKPVVLHADVRPPRPMRPGQILRRDCEYERRGTANVFCGVEPKAGRHFTKPTSSSRGKTARIGNALPGSNPAESPLQAIFEFRLRESSETHSLMFPHYPGIQLSRDYEYAVHLTALRPGWILLISVNPDQRLSLLLPARAPSNQVPSLKAGGVMRFPSGSAWDPVAANSGRHKLYALYLDNAKAAEELVAESRRAEDTGASAVALEKELDEMVVTGGCASLSRPCVLTFEYEVF
jgi:hypothetical protein